MSGISLYGLGKVIHDAHYERQAGELFYRGSRGGGSVWNILANAASTGIPVGGIGVGGDDARAELVLQDNADLGIQNVFIDLLAGRITGTMHHFPSSSANSSIRFQTTSKCLRCFNRVSSAKLNESPRLNAGLDSLELLPSILVVDQLTQQTAGWAAASKVSGWTTAIDLGYPGYLRFSHANTLISQLRAFDLIVAQRGVASFLVGKLQPGGTADDVARTLGTILLISDGDRGLSAYDGRGGRVKTFRVEAPTTEVVDTVGAGDTLLGGILSAAIKSGHRNGSLSESTNDIEDWCHESMELIPRALERVGARGHLGGAGLRLLDSDSIQSGHNPCPICGSIVLPLAETKRTPSRSLALSQQNLNSRRRKLESLVLESEAVELCKVVIRDPRNTIVTGTGGSFAAAQAIARILNYAWRAVESPNHKAGAEKPVAIAMRPLEVLESARGFSRIVGVSYSGRTPDVRQAMELAGLYGAEQVLVTAGVPNTSGSLESGQLMTIGYGISEKGSLRGVERGFISIAATLAPVVLWTSAVENLDLVRDVVRSNDLILKAEEAASLLADHCGPRGEGGLAVIGGGWAHAGMLDIESKFVEGGLAPITLHELKDFSHGRFVSMAAAVSLTKTALLLGIGKPTPYEELLHQTLERQLGDTRVASLRTNGTGPLAMLEMLLASQSFAVKFGLSKDIDISKPAPFSKDWLALYRWSEPLNPFYELPPS